MEETINSNQPHWLRSIATQIEERDVNLWSKSRFNEATNQFVAEAGVSNTTISVVGVFNKKPTKQQLSQLKRSALGIWVAQVQAKS